jgi:outer membrane protein assembly factor BamA
LAQIEPGAPYDLDAVHEAIQRMRDWYLKGGFAATRITPRLEPVGTDYEIVFDVNEGDSATIGEVKISGLRRTRESLVRSCVEFRAGEPLDPRRLVKLERRLLDLGVFSRVAVTASNEAPATIQVDVEERGPYSLAYDVRFSGAERATGSLDAELGNVAGLGVALGARHRQGTGLRESRASIVAPAIGRARGLTLALFRSDERFDFLRGRRALKDPLADRVLQEGLEVRQSLEFRDAWKVVYGYRYKVLTRQPNGFTRNVAGVEISLIRDTRDDPLDAHRGRFWSLSLDVLQRPLGSDFSLVRLFGQAFVTRPLRKPWFWAQGYRFGVATGLDETQRAETQLFGRATELFRAGGASSLRGFAPDSIGPKGSIPGIAAGGDAVIILNQELRYQHATGLGAAIFYDAGNVFPRLGDLGFQLRHSVGAGLRYSSPVGLLRMDVGVPIGREPGERAFQWFFSIGQAF